MSGPRQYFVPIDNRWGAGEMSVLDFGDPHRAPDMVFLHANGFTGATYRALLAPLAASWRILAPDLRGHGASRLPTNTRGRWSWRDHRDDVRGLMDHLRGRHPGASLALAGHSMGAVVALLAADGRPAQVSRLVMFDPVILPAPAALAMSLPPLTLMARRYPLTQGALRRRARFDSRQAALDAYRGRGAFKGWPEAMLADYVASAFEDDPEGGVRLICAPRWEASNYAAQGANPWPALQRLDRPARILKAQHNSTCSLEDGRFEAVSVETVPNGTHFFPMLQSDTARAALFSA